MSDGGGSCETLDPENHYFCGVTDEHANVLLSHAIGGNQAEYEKLHNFTELLRVPDLNGLQCWKFYVQGEGFYDEHTDVCVESDSASDASLRILHAYALACSKQSTGVWAVSAVDYCADYLEQGRAIWGMSTPLHGEVARLPNGEAFLANGFNNQPFAPIATDSFRPDYYELGALISFARYVGDAEAQADVGSMLDHYIRSLGDNQVHCGKTGHFDANATIYTCDQLCSPPYMDNVDTWRAIPALALLRQLSGEDTLGPAANQVFEYWWDNYSGGHASMFGPTQPKPFEINCSSADGGVRQVEDSYKTLGMWIPLAVSFDAEYARAAVRHLVESKYDATNQRFFGSAFFGGFYSQYGQRALASATGLIDPQMGVFSDGFESGDLGAWSSFTPQR